jgi:hypothetical protein
MNNLNNLLITLFIILFCYILAYRVYKLYFSYKIIEGIEDKPKLATTDAIQEEEQEEDKPMTEEEKKEQSKKFTDKTTDSNKNRRKSPPSDKLLQAKFN